LAPFPLSVVQCTLSSRWNWSWIRLFAFPSGIILFLLVMPYQRYQIFFFPSPALECLVSPPPLPGCKSLPWFVYADLIVAPPTFARNSLSQLVPFSRFPSLNCGARVFLPRIFDVALQHLSACFFYVLFLFFFGSTLSMNCLLTLSLLLLFSSFLQRGQLAIHEQIEPHPRCGEILFLWFFLSSIRVSSLWCVPLLE